MNSAITWRRLLWKDFQQTKLMLLGVVGLLFFAQLAIWSMYPHPSAAIVCQGIAALTPALLSAGCAGLMFGDERQSGTWAWSSSLPIAWWQALLSKYAVWLMVSAIGTLTLTISAMTLTLITGGGIRTGVQVSFLDPVELLLGFVTCFVVLSLAAMLFADTLTSMVCAAVILLIGHCNSIWWTVAALAAGGLFSAITFRWRWGSGQTAAIGWRMSENARSDSVWSPSVWSEASARRRPATYRASLFWLAMRSALSLRAFLILVFVVLSVLCLMHAPQRDTFLSWFVLPVIIIVVPLLGVSAFCADQTKRRYGFLADRGVEPWYYLIFQSAICLALLFPWIYVGFPYQSGFAFAGIGVLASLCFTNATIASLFSILVCLFSYIQYLQMYRWAEINPWVGMLPWLNGVLPVLVLAIIYQSRRWMIFARSENPLLFFGTIILGIVGFVTAAAGLQLLAVALENRNIIPSTRFVTDRSPYFNLARWELMRVNMRACE